MSVFGCVRLNHYERFFRPPTIMKAVLQQVVPSSRFRTPVMPQRLQSGLAMGVHTAGREEKLLGKQAFD